MKNIFLLVFLIIIWTSLAFAQDPIKAKDAYKYVGKTMTIIDKIRSIAGPGYFTWMEFYLVTDSIERGISITVPMEIWSKSKVLNEQQEGKIMKVTGLIKSIKDASDPYIEVKSMTDIEILE